VRDKIFTIIKEAVTDLNEELDYDSLKNVSEQTTIFGGDDGIDSLSLVMLVTEIESLVFDQLNLSISLADEKAMSMRNSPYRNVGALLDFALSKVEAA
jgi:acyl carrier protein|tara:strand:+ start:595 stop:888 length:294 start_codon:yes stop_codon:yes gene_type:complete